MGAMWPLILPQCPLRASYKRTLPNMTIRSSMDTGPDKVRYRGGHSPMTVDAAYFLTAAQLLALVFCALLAECLQHLLHDAVIHCPSPP